jgi:hypothetical protein
MVTIGEQIQLYVLAAMGLGTLAIAAWHAVGARRSLLDAACDLLQFWAGSGVVLFGLQAL